ncbi:TonB-dependent receptor [Solilutibacter silvestris]|uniref:TonB-dependent Receptor Plug Domain n=1 Tax=Solilutibacter silvestris TaxID=1645665 RepID=A0A2K1Q132_9GAMM|nr:TonB-dependent receptor [Lysobacter silvestris]PNS08743.1 TonB-dependent Receptor Plug Domain [Lysobacter silvestris]
MASDSISIKSGFKRSALTVALGLCFAATVHAQSTTGSVFGTAAPGETITLVSETGFARTITADGAGRYNAGNLPIGNYAVTARKGDQVVGTKQVLVKVSSGTEASFAGAQAATSNELGTITVTATGAGIDVTQVDSRTVITAKDLAVLPVAHSAEAIALLAPGTVKGSGFFNSAVSFGGAGVTENAYYINGFNVSDPLANIGGLSLPYGSIAQQETYTGGYSAMYGRSDGGVISQVGKRGTNDWHFGGQISVRPKSLASAPKDVYFPKAMPFPSGFAGVYAPGTDGYYSADTKVANSTCTPQVAGQYCWHYDKPGDLGMLRTRRGEDKLWNTTYSAYVGGPLVPNKLFFFLSAEESKDSFITTQNEAGINSTTGQYNLVRREHDNTTDKKIYGKIDWNINDSNIVELTGIKENDNTHGSSYNYDYTTLSQGAYRSPSTPTKQNTFVYIAKYTNYLTDNLNFSVTYGKDSVRNPTMLAVESSLPFINNRQNIPSAYLPAGGLVLPQISNAGATPGSRLTASGVRFDVEWKVGAHQLHGGIDDMTYTAKDQGGTTSGPGYFWDYRAGGAVVRQTYFNSLASMSVVQKAIYLEDNWSITDRFLLKVGLRSDDFNNKNNAGQSYVHEKHQIAPRLGFAWDLKGDSTMKVFGNVGRYYLALPNEVAIRGASPSTFYYVPYNYTGVDVNGQPTGLTQAGAPFSANGEFGQAVDPNSIAAKSLKPQYQDEAILGFDWQFSKKWIAGAKLTYRKLGTLIDDWCDTGRVANALDPSGGGAPDYTIPGCYIINPGRTNTFHVAKADGSGYTDVTLSNAQLGFNSSNAAKPIRKYEALDLYLEHPFDGKWQYRVDYTWSRNPGNTEGQVKSDIGQTDVSKTQDWDYAGLMYNSYGYMANDRRHALRMRGMYQFTPEWLVTGKLLVQSGVPKNCLGYYFNDSDPIGYGSSYHTCFNQPSAPGAQHGPWTKQLDLGIVYRPRYFNKKLTAALDVFNITNDRKPIQYSAQMETSALRNHGDGTILSTYNIPIFFQSPRYVQLSVSYDY